MAPWRVRGNTILQYSLATFGIVTVISIALGVTLTRRIAAYQVDSQVRLYQQVAQIAFKDEADIDALFKSDTPGVVSPHLESLFRNFRKGRHDSLERPGKPDRSKVPGQ
jgi:hypothetical protein